MINHIVTSDIFIGRKEALAIIASFISFKEEENVLLISSNGAGGIGKTRLLRKLIEYKKEHRDSFINLNKIETFVDFYETENRYEIGLLKNIARYLEQGSDEHSIFPSFKNKYSEFEKNFGDISIREKIISEAKSIFITEYEKYVDELKHEDKNILFIFDSYEYIQFTDNKTENTTARNSDFANFFKKLIIENLSKSNTKFVIAGRFEIVELKEFSETSKNLLKVKEILLDNFTIDETKDYWKEFLGLRAKKNMDNSDIMNRFGTKDKIELYRKLSQGKPILLALIFDYISFKPNEIFKHFQEYEIQSEINFETIEKFENFIVRELTLSEENPLTNALLIMSLSTRRLDAEFLSFMIGESLENCLDYLEQLSKYSFVKKYENTNIYTLHDIIDVLLNKYYWVGDKKTKRIAILKLIIDYYSKKQSKNFEIYFYKSELLEYLFEAENEDSIKNFILEYEKGSDEGMKDHCERILSIAEKYTKVEHKEYFDVVCKRIDYYINNSDFNKATEIVEEYYVKEEILNTIYEGIIKFYKGEILLWENKISEAKKEFESSQIIFYTKIDNKWLYKSNLKIGVCYFRMSSFENALNWLDVTLKDFTVLLEEKSLIKQSQINVQISLEENILFRTLLKDISQTLAYLSLTYRYLGDFNNAIRFSKVLMIVAESIGNNSKEIARATASYCQILILTPRSIEAKNQVEKGLNIIKNITDVVIESRLKTVNAWLNYHEIESSYLTDFFRSEEFDNKLDFYYKQIYGVLDYQKIKETKMLFKEVYNKLNKKYEDKINILKEKKSIEEAEKLASTREFAELLLYYSEFTLLIPHTFEKQVFKEAKTIKDKYFEKVYESDENIKITAINQTDNEIYNATIKGLKVENNISLYNNIDLVDDIKEKLNVDVTIFQKFNHGFVRISTTILDKNGNRAVNTFLPHTSSVVAKINTGEIYEGYAYVLNDFIYTIYEPIKINNEIIGIFFISSNRWKNSEQLLLKGLKIARNSDFKYLEFQILSKLISNYYFWHGFLNSNEKENKPDKNRVLDLLNERSKDFIKLSSTETQDYFDILANFNITKGDISFDNGIIILNEDKNWTNPFPFIGAFEKYVTGIMFVKNYNLDKYNYYLRIFYDRIKTLSEKLQTANVPFDDINNLELIRNNWQVPKTSKEISSLLNNICDYVLINYYTRREKVEQLLNKHYRYIPINVEKGDWTKLSLFNNSVLSYYEKQFNYFATQSNLEIYVFSAFNQCFNYFQLNDLFRALTLIEEVKKSIETIENSTKIAPEILLVLKAVIETIEGLLKYRKGDFSLFFEYYLNGELVILKNRFEINYPKELENAEKLLVNAEDIINRFIAENEKVKMTDFTEKYQRRLGSCRLFLAELYTLTNEFDKAIVILNKTKENKTLAEKDEIRFYDSLESLIATLYFSKKYENVESDKKIDIEMQQIELLFENMDKNKYRDIWSRLSILKADNIFSKHFKIIQNEDLEASVEKRTEEEFSDSDFAEIRNMVLFYIEACNYMEKYNESNFQITVRILQRRMELIPKENYNNPNDKKRSVLKTIYDGFRSMWLLQPNLIHRKKELESLIQLSELKYISTQVSNYIK